MIHFITYGDGLYDETKKRLHNQANNLGWFDTITSYGPDDLEQDFKEQFKDILELPRGGGYWIWKPYIIKKHLDKINDNDILVYLDAGCSINSNGKNRYNEYIEMLKQRDEGCISFQMPHLENTFTIKEIFQYFNVENNSEITNSGQFIATVQMIKKNPNSIKLLELWNNTLHDNPLLFTDYYNNTQGSYFIDNRHDQSVCSVILKMNNSIIIPTNETYVVPFGSAESLKYPFWATRKRY